MFGGHTEIGIDSKLDNLVHIAHSARIGSRCLIAAGAIVAGSARIGDDVWIGPGACVSDHVTIEAGAQITLGSSVFSNVRAGQRVSGNPALEHREFLRLCASQRIAASR